METFNLNHIGLANLQIPGLDPVAFSAFGMAVVFCGLLIISLYIYFLPKLLEGASWCKNKLLKHKKDIDGSEKGASVARETEIIMAIAAAFHLDQNFPEETQKLTWLSHGLDESAWSTSGLSHGVSRRHNLHITRRKF